MTLQPGLVVRVGVRHGEPGDGSHLVRVGRGGAYGEETADALAGHPDRSVADLGLGAEVVEVLAGVS